MKEDLEPITPDRRAEIIHWRTQSLDYRADRPWAKLLITVVVCIASVPHAHREIATTALCGSAWVRTQVSTLHVEKQVLELVTRKICRSGLEIRCIRTIRRTA